MQYCERSLLESQRPGTALHSFFTGLVPLVAGLYWLISSGSISEVSLIIFSSGQAPKMIRSCRTSAGEAKKQGLVHPGEKEALGGLAAASQHLQGGYQWEEPYSSQHCMVGGWETRKIQTRYWESHFHHDKSQAVEQLAQRGCAGSVLAGFQDLSN